MEVQFIDFFWFFLKTAGILAPSPRILFLFGARKNCIPTPALARIEVRRERKQGGPGNPAVGWAGRGDTSAPHQYGCRLRLRMSSCLWRALDPKRENAAGGNWRLKRPGSVSASEPAGVWRRGGAARRGSFGVASLCQARQRLGTEPLFWGRGPWPALYLLPCFVGRARSPLRSAHVPPSRGVPPRAVAASRRPGEVPGVLSRLLCGAAGARGEQGWAGWVSARALGLALGGCSTPQAPPTSWWACRVTPRSPARFWRLNSFGT